MAAKFSIPAKKEVATHKEVTADVPNGIYEPLMAEIEARNQRLEDDADASFFVAYGLQMVTEALIAERLDAEKKPKEDKRGRKPNKPDMHVVAQSA